MPTTRSLPVSSQYTSCLYLSRDLGDKDIELQCGTVLRQSTLVRHTFFGRPLLEASALGAPLTQWSELQKSGRQASP